jgi:hypothetical protein
MVIFLYCIYTGNFYVTWLVLVSACFIYNAWVIPLRAVFPYQTKDNLHIWIGLDAFADVVYLLDVVAFKAHRKFLQEGFWIKIPSEARKSYYKTLQFKVSKVKILIRKFSFQLKKSQHFMYLLGWLREVSSFFPLQEGFPFSSCVQV